MPGVGILFELRRAETRPGEVIRVVGDRPELAAWDPYHECSAGALELRTSSSSYPRWALLNPVYIEVFASEGSQSSSGFPGGDDSDVSSSPPTTPRATDCASVVETLGADSDSAPLMKIEYKYVKDRQQLGHTGGPSIEWEDRIANRRITLPQEPGTIWVVSDTTFNLQEPPRISRAILPEVVQRWEDLDPEWTTRAQGCGAPEWSEREGEELISPRSELTSVSGHTTSTSGPFRFT